MFYDFSASILPPLSLSFSFTLSLRNSNARHTINHIAPERRRFGTTPMCLLTYIYFNIISHSVPPHNVLATLTATGISARLYRTRHYRQHARDKTHTHTYIHRHRHSRQQHMCAGILQLVVIIRKYLPDILGCRYCESTLRVSVCRCVGVWYALSPLLAENFCARVFTKTQTRHDTTHKIRDAYTHRDTRMGHCPRMFSSRIGFRGGCCGASRVRFFRSILPARVVIASLFYTFFADTLWGAFASFVSWLRKKYEFW